MTADKTLTKEEFLTKHCGEFDNKGAWRVFDKETKLSDLNALLRTEVEEHDKKRAKDYPDTEADGYVFCGKCGAMKTI
jgi:hypothetical protein